MKSPSYSLVVLSVLLVWCPRVRAQQPETPPGTRAEVPAQQDAEVTSSPTSADAAAPAADEAPELPAQATEKDVEEAEEALPPPETGLPEDASSWEPPTSKRESWDWVLTTTGEWLKGEIGSVRDGDMEFESDQLGELTLDMEDVAAAYAYRPHIYQLTDRSTLVGVGILRGDQVVIDGQILSRDDFLGMVDGTPREINYWNMKLNVSLSTRKGNTNQATLSDTLFVRRDAPGNRLTLDTNGTIGQTNDRLNVQTQTGLLQFDVFVSRVFYVTPAFLSATHDRFQNIDVRAIPGSGVGAHAVDTSDVTWDVEAGGGYQYINYRGERRGHNDGVVRLATRFSVDVGDPLDVDLSWNSNLIVSDIGRTFHHGQVTLALEITDVIDSTISLIYDRVEQPQRNEDGDLPTSNDVQINFGVQIELG